MLDRNFLATFSGGETVRRQITENCALILNNNYVREFFTC